MGKGGEPTIKASKEPYEMERGSEEKSSKGFNKNLAIAVGAAALGSAFQHGYNTGVINNPQEVIMNFTSSVLQKRNGEHPTETALTLIWSITVSIYCVGGMIGGAITGYVANTFGRKKGLLMNNIIVFLAALLEGVSKSANSFEMIIFGRFLIGINSGLNAGLAPMYLSEISPVNLRGAIGSVYQLVITISILIAQILGINSILGNDAMWPVLLAITALPALLQLAILPLCPESPKYLLCTKQKQTEAQKALIWLRSSPSVQQEMDEMQQEAQTLKMIQKVTLRELIVQPALRIPLIISIVLMIAQQLSGINAVIFYSTEIFKSSGLTIEAASYATLAIGFINVVMTVISLILVEKAGRKTLLLIGFGGMSIVTLLLSIALQYHNVQAVSYLSIFLVVLFIILFATGPGSIPWFIVSELFNQSSRPTATSLAVTVNWIANFFVGIGFLPLKNIIGAHVFIIFTVILVLTVVFTYRKVPETKNKTMEEISTLFRQQSYQ
ncbi:solute carrier family 2, facilitated glucose transporter member 1-like [Onthophagus taurus]|uniref:solute carrier family 2, facilitated glucose transporter member 1-like n=1 Tax=Onthophagus taurus TaxID=166361 RepID=UPI0039BE681D